MNASWLQLKELFHTALELAPPEREAFLKGNCGGDDDLHNEVSALLSAHDTAGDFIEQPALVDVGLILNEEQTNSVAVEGQRIGSYRIIRELGRGGMGSVYLAARADESFDKQVALKLIKRGMDSDAIIKHFVMERQILANLDHPNIARLIDGGTTEDGLPYFVLEYVEGTNITRYCDQHKLNTIERVKLFRQVCAAVVFAHQNLIVHRDIKPSNIIVTADGTPKLLDFGIAKLLSADRSSSSEGTATIGRLLTPEYASPEELRGLPVTTSSDVYSLGVVLYELLSGNRPFNFDNRLPEDVARIITASQPLKPSVAITHIKDARQTNDTDRAALTPEAICRARDGSVDKLRRRLVGDLDNILLKALRNEPERRYASVNEFSDDLRRHLEGLPVFARPDTLSYRTSKFITRHKAGVVAAVIVLLTLISATAITSWQARVARRERDKAERRFNQVRRLANSVLFDYHDGIEKLPGSTPIREKMIKDTLEYLDNLSSESKGDALLQRELATAYEKVGNVQGNPYRANLGNQDGALASYRKALSIREALYAANHADAKLRLELSNSYQSVADILWAKGENDAALVNYRNALTNYSELAQADPKNLQYANGINATLNGIGNVQRQRGDFNGALETYRKFLANAEALLAADARDKHNLRRLAVANLRVGDALMDVTDYAGALLHYEKSVEGFSELAASAQNNAPAVRELGLICARIASVHRRLRQYEKAAEFSLKAIEQQKQVAAADPSNVQAYFDIAATYGNLSDNYLQIKRLDDAVTSVREAIRIFSEGLAKNPNYLQAQGNLGETYTTYGEILVVRGQANSALENFRKALTILEREPLRSGRTRGLASTYEGLGNAHAALAENRKTSTQMRLDHWREARSWLQKSLEIYRVIRDAGKLTGEEAAKVDVVTEEITKCDAAIARLGGKAYYETVGSEYGVLGGIVLGLILLPGAFKPPLILFAALDAERRRPSVNRNSILHASGGTHRRAHYREHELPDMFYSDSSEATCDDETRKSYSTQYNYDNYLRKWILPRWRPYRLSEVKAVEVERWLKTLTFEDGNALSRGTKAKIRNIMSALYAHAIRWEWTTRNPITSVRQSAKRQTIPEVLTVEEIVNLLNAIPEPFRTAVFLDGTSGLRVGELLGLKWEDVDFKQNVIHIRRSIVKQKIGPPKTEASQKPIPMNAEVAKALRLWKMKTTYNRPDDWVYASPVTNGKQPYWPNSIYRVYIKPAAESIGLTKRFGWHTFRHTFGTILNANGVNPKVVQELLRHATLKVTMDTYVQAVSDEKRKAQRKVVEMLLPGIRRAVR